MIQQRPENWRLGVGITAMSFLAFTLMDVCIKWVGLGCPVSEQFCMGLAQIRS
jgi:hypothetical protein